MTEEIGVLFEKGSAKWLELIPSNARFHSDIDRATRVSKADYDDPVKRGHLLNHHNVDWYSSTIVWQSVPS